MIPALAIFVLAQAKREVRATPSLPASFVQATAFLLAHGFGDPRGGEYRKATIRAAGFRGKPQTVYGWVFFHAKPLRIVTGMGLVYEAATAGARIDLGRDVAERKAGRAGPGGVDSEENDFLFAAELSIAGRADLAATLLRPGPNGQSEAVGMLSDFPSALLAQAVQAHETGDDVLARRAAQQFATEEPAFATELGHHKAASLPDPRNATIAAEIASDSSRRLAHARLALDLDALRTRPVAERVEILIDRLDDVEATGIMFDGFDPGQAPLVVALVAIGAPAAEPVLDCIEGDTRLTRAVDSGGEFGERVHYQLGTVRQAAYAALQGILQVRTLPLPTEIPALRTFWKANQSRTPAERWMAILADDTAGDLCWGEAARSLFGYAELSAPPSPLPAATLRGKTSPSLDEVLIRRLRVLAPLDPTAPSAWGSVLDLSLRLSADLAIWSPATALPTLQATTHQAMTSGIGLDKLREVFAEAIERRGDIEGDPAWDEYAAWARRVSTEPTGRFETQAFRPLLDRRNVPQIRDAMRAVFASPDSSWSLARREHSAWGAAWAEPYVLSPLLDDPTFLKAVLEALQDRTPVGDVVVDRRGGVECRTSDSSAGPGQDDGRVLKDSLRPSFDAPRSLRACDQIAAAVARLKGAPRYQPYWPDTQRDAAIGCLSSFLRRKAGQLSKRLPPTEFFEPILVP